MQLPYMATQSLAIRSAKLALVATFALSILAGFTAEGLVNSQTWGGDLSYASGALVSVTQSSALFMYEGGLWVWVHLSDLGATAHFGIGQFYFGELIMASILIPVVVYISSATFPGAITAASNVTETAWSTTTKTLWNNVYPLMVVVSALMLPLTWIILPFATMGGRAYA